MFLRKCILLVLVTLTLSITIVAQQASDYVKNWQKVEAFEKKGLTKSALVEVMTIYNLALKDYNNAQQIKAVIYQIKYRNLVQEDSREENIFFVDTLIAKAKAPVKNILQSMQAEMFWQYLQNNRYKFYGRTKLADEKSNDVSSWSLDKLQDTISALYNASLSKGTMLQSTKLTNFDATIIKGENTRQLRPSLFDFLAFRALSYFMNDETDITRPAYQFSINNPQAFAPAAEFIKANFANEDTSSLHYNAIVLLQNILQFHLKDANTDALLDADLIRLNFVNQYAVNDDKSKLYEVALKNIEDNYTGNPTSAQAMYLRAQIYYQRGQQYEPFTSTASQYDIRRAKELCDTAIKKWPKTEGGINAQNMLVGIVRPSLQLETEQVNVPQQPFRTLVNYKNAKTVYFRIIKTSREEIKKMDRRDYDKLWKNIVSLQAVKTWSVSLPDLQDYQTHSAEIKVDGLTNGTYFILASLDENFSLQKNIIAKQLTYVSNISYIKNNKDEYYVLNRNNGQPYNNAQVQVWQTKYNYTNSANEDVKAENYTTDKNGLFKLKKSKEYTNILLQIKSGSDELFLDDNNYTTYYNSYEKPEQTKPVTFLFTDRSMYRPGQTVYFKGIIIKKGMQATETSILPSFNTAIQLKDANNQKFAEIKMVTNEFGSYHGSFKLPEGALNGQFSLYDTSTHTSQYFNVEEYKRPKFFVEVQKPKGTYRLLDSITITGSAKAYAGNIIDGAKVKYRVVRKVRYRWYVWGNYSPKGRPGFPLGNKEEVEITNGEAVTDVKGKFSVRFKAIPDESVDKKTQPTFYYEVSADITDLNGETRSGNTSVAVAYQMLQLEIIMPDKILIDSLKNISVKSTNLNDIEEKTIATVTIQQLKTPAKIFRKRYWNEPDQFVMSKDEYYNYFPYDVYKDENEVKNYEVVDKVLENTDSTNRAPIAIGRSMVNEQYIAGWYKVVATAKDKYGEVVKAEKYIQLYSNKTNESTDNAIELTTDKNTAEPGQKINYSIKTGFQNIWLIQTISKVDETNNTTYQTIKSTAPLKNEIAVNEMDRGGIAISYAFVRHNRVYKGAENFDIPWSNKELTIDYSTFRNKLLPGSEEKWTIKISGSKGEKAAAEILAGMYDASLDQFNPHSWRALNIWPRLYNSISWTENGFKGVNSEVYQWYENIYTNSIAKSYDQLLYFNSYDLNKVIVTGYGAMKRKGVPGASERVYDRAIMAAPPLNQTLQGKVAGVSIAANEEIQENQQLVADSVSHYELETPVQLTNQSVQIRKNFKETAFFFPDLQTDAAGNVSFSFTMPEALTQWKLMTFAHTKTLASGYSEKTTVTQKPLMIQTNAPRFLREGDAIEFSAKIVNLSDKEITGTTQLELLDVATDKPVDGWFKNVFPTQYFTVAAGQSTAVKFPIEVPFNFNSAMTYRIVAMSTNSNNLKSGDKTTDSSNNSPLQGPDSLSGGDGGSFSDGEEMTIPILTNRMLVTESLPINLRNQTAKHFRFEKLLNSDSSETITNHALTLEYTSNPAWYAVQALPYLMEYPYECAEQTFNRYYANTLASCVSNTMPKIKVVFEKWRSVDTAALLSNLQKNEELKSALIEETPWVLDAKNENQQKKNIALLFDMVRMSSEKEKAISKLQDMQSSNGGFVWFKGGPDDRYITQYIITGIGHLKKLNALSGNSAGQLKDIMGIVNNALPYLDKKIKEEYDNLVKSKTNLTNNNLSHTAIQYLYMRSFFTENAIATPSQTAYTYYREQAKKYWLSNSKYMQAMIALELHRSQDDATAKAIVKSLKENAIINEQLGMYWKEWTTGGYYWYQAPIESQAIMIEAFTDIDQNPGTVNDLKTWLLQQKQTQNWKTTKATAEACYALLLINPHSGKSGYLGSSFLNQETEVSIRLGGMSIKSSNNMVESGTGYFKKTIEGEKVKAEMGNIEVSIKSADSKSPPSGGWGAIYWQYFEDLDKITSAVTTPLQISKKLFLEKNTDKGPVLEAITDEAELNVGDKVKVRIELKADRDMEYIHLKDMRAACMEPTNVISQYKYQGGLGYYETTKDASTNFFFGRLPRGSYVFEYPMFVTHAGNFSNGVTTIQCMYAPEFTSHSEGIRVNAAP